MSLTQLTIVTVDTGASQALPVADAIALVQSNPSVYRIDPPLGDGAFLAEALLEAYILAGGPSDATYADLLARLAGPASGVSTRAALTAAAPRLFDGDMVRVAGYAAPGDGGGADYIWNAASTAADDGGTILAPAGGGSGRLVWAQTKPDVDPRMFGVKFDNNSASAAANVTAWNKLIAALNAGNMGTVRVPGLPCYINAPLNPILVDKASIFGKKSSRLIMAAGATSGKFFHVGSDAVSVDQFTLEGMTFECKNLTTLSSTSEHAVVLHNANRPIVRDLEFINTAGAMRFGSGTGVVSNPTIASMRGTVLLDAGLSIWHWQRVNGGTFDDLAVNGFVNVAPNAGFRGLAIIPMNTGTDPAPPDPPLHRECDGNVVRTMKMNLVSNPNCVLIYIDITNGALDNLRIIDSTFDLGINYIMHIFCGASPIAGSEVTRLKISDTRLTPSTFGGNTNPAIKIENTGDVPIEILISDKSIIGMAQGVGVSVTGVAASTKTRVTLDNPLFNDRANGAGSPRSCVESNVAGVQISDADIVAAAYGDAVEVDYLLNLTAGVTSYDVFGNKCAAVSAGVVNVSQQAATIMNTQRIANNQSPFGAGVLRTLSTPNATPLTLAQVTLVNSSVYRIRAVVVGIKSDGTARARYILEATYYRTGGAGPVLQGAISVTADESNAAWDATFDVSSNLVRLRVTGEAATVNWSLIEFSYPKTSE